MQISTVQGVEIAIFGTYINCMQLSMAIGMQQHQVVQLVPAASDPFDDVVDVPLRFMGDQMAAMGAALPLPEPKRQYLPPALH